MLKFILSKLGLAALVALTVSFFSFMLLFMAGDPAIAIAGHEAPPEAIAAIRAQYGFDKPLLTQYAQWLMRALSGDFGMSYYFKVPVADLIADRLPVTFIVGSLGMSFALIVAIPMGVIAAAFPEHDHRPHRPGYRRRRPGNPELLVRADPDCHLCCQSRVVPASGTRCGPAISCPWSCLVTMPRPPSCA
ncbi:ABC transporter permease [Pannonibacter sp. Pt2-lr]